MPQNSNFSQKIEVTVMAPNHGGDPLGFILGPMGSHWVQNMGLNRKKLPCPKTRIFGYPAVIDFSQKIEVPRWGPPRVHLGVNGALLVKKMGQNRKRLTCPKIRIFGYPAVIDFSQKSTLRLWRQIKVGTP